MTVSTTFTYDPTVAEVFDEAFERAGVAPESIEHRHIISAKRSLNFILNQIFSERPDARANVDRETATLAAGSSTYTLPAGTIDVIDVVVRTTGETADIPVQRTNRDDYLYLANKTTTASRPSQYYINDETPNAPVMVFWPVLSAECTLTYDRLHWPATVTAMGETLDVRRNWTAAITAGLALALAEKFNPERIQMLAPRYQEAMHQAKLEMSGRGTVIIAGRGFGRARRRRL